MKYIFNASPNYRDRLSTQGIMRDLTIGLLVVFAFGLVNQYVTYGMSNMVHSIIMMVLALVSTLVTEGVWAAVMKRPVAETLKNSFGWVTAIIFVLMLPSTATYFSVVVCTVLAIVFAKLLFGGFGHNIFNPAAVARAMFMASFVAATAVDVVSKATPTGTFANAGWAAVSAESFNEFLSSFGGLFNFVLGFYPGAIGETSFLVIALVGAFLVVRRVIDWRVPVTYIGTLFILSFVLGMMQGQPLTYALYHVLTGGAIFGAVFMLTDPVTSPTCASGRIFFSIGAAILTLIIRVAASYPEGVLYSILLMNMVTPLIERLFDSVQIDSKKKFLRNNLIFLVVGIVLTAVISFKVTANDMSYPKVVDLFGSSNSAAAAELADGTYSGTAKGFAGDITAEFTISGGKVTEITIDGAAETPTFGGAAIETITEQILSSESLEFDAVAGSTFTSTGVADAIATALDGGAN